MKTHSLEELESMFLEMGLGTTAHRQRFLFETVQTPEAEEASPQVFIRMQASTLPEEGVSDAKLA